MTIFKTKAMAVTSPKELLPSVNNIVKHYYRGNYNANNA